MSKEEQEKWENGAEAAKPQPHRPEFQALLDFIGQCIAKDLIVVNKGPNHDDEK